MSIREHKWSDEDIKDGATFDKREDWLELELVQVDYEGGPQSITFSKRDAIAIAKHFNVDRESLVLKLKELVFEYENYIHHQVHDDKSKASLERVCEELKRLIC